MGQIIIKLKFNLETGKKDILIDYASDEDHLGHEHEKRHKEIVEELIGKGVLDRDEVGEIKVTRILEEIDVETDRRDHDEYDQREQQAEPG